MSKFAKDTTVDEGRSRSEIESTLKRYGADRFAYMCDSSYAHVAFEINQRRIRISINLPQRRDFYKTESGLTRTTSAAITTAYEKAQRQIWRALLLVIKAKLESVDSGIETLEEAFMPHVLLPDGRTVSEWLTPQIELAYASRQMPPLLGSGQ